MVNIVDLGIAYSMNMIAVQRDFYRRSPKTVDGLVRGYTEGVAALNRDKNRALESDHQVYARHGPEIFGGPVRGFNHILGAYTKG